MLQRNDRRSNTETASAKIACPGFWLTRGTWTTKWRYSLAPRYILWEYLALDEDSISGMEV